MNLQKPLKGQAKLDAFARKQARMKEKNAAAMRVKRDRMRVYREARKQVYARDGMRCRACRCEVKLESYNPHLVAHVHHLVYRSAGGTDETSNLILLCAVCHQWEHEHRLSIEGNADERVTLRYYDVITRKVIQEWSA